MDGFEKEKLCFFTKMSDKIDYNLVCDLIEKYDLNSKGNNQEKKIVWESIVQDYNAEKIVIKTVKQVQDSWYGHLRRTKKKLSNYKAGMKQTGV